MDYMVKQGVLLSPRSKAIRIPKGNSWCTANGTSLSTYLNPSSANNLRLHASKYLEPTCSPLSNQFSLMHLRRCEKSLGIEWCQQSLTLLVFFFTRHQYRIGRIGLSEVATDAGDVFVDFDEDPPRAHVSSAACSCLRYYV